MSLEFDHRANTLYQHVTSIAPREAARNPKPVSPLGELKTAQWAEEAHLRAKHRRQGIELDQAHYERRKKDTLARNGVISQHLQDTEAAERKALQDRQDADDQRLATRHKAAREVLLRGGHAAP